MNRKKIRVLWFTNAPTLARNKLGFASFGGGWMDSLQAQIEKNNSVAMGVGFHWPQKIENFNLGNTKYYPIYRENPKNIILRTFQFSKKKPDFILSKYMAVVQDFKPDVIHIFGSESTFGYIVQKTDIPVVIWFQGSITLCNHKWHSAIKPLEFHKYSDKLKTLKGRGIISRYRQLIITEVHEKQILKNIKFFIGRTDWDRRITQVMSKNSVYFHVDEMLREPFYNHTWSQPQTDTFTLISVLSAQPFKGFETIFQSIEILKDNGVNSISWSIIGSKSTDEVIKIFFRKYKIDIDSPEVSFLGMKSPEELIKMCLKSDVFVHPSHMDNSPNSIQEAMLIGMPVVATFAGGIPSLLEANKEGLLVQDGDPYALAGALYRIYKDKDFAGTLGANARKRGLIRQNKDKILNDLLDVYYSIIEKDKTNNQIDI